MTLSNATFTAVRGCLIQIAGMLADIDTKLSLLREGVCSIVALNAADAEALYELMATPCGQDGTSYGCNEPRLVELAARYRAWLDDDKNAPWADTTATPLAPVDAAMAFQQFLATLNPA
ncbi:hypothetical protein [Prosthecobacter sp.]|uniref:hypothetical protein n=1 Tax=Prosthecobacter sp. TaxID=1965333 RepID=UPI003784E496